jgi:hypothetical protein
MPSLCPISNSTTYSSFRYKYRNSLYRVTPEIPQKSHFFRYLKISLQKHISLLPDSLEIVKDLIRVFTLRMVAKQLIEGGVPSGYQYLLSCYQNIKYTKTLEPVFIQLYPVMSRAIEEIGIPPKYPLLTILRGGSIRRTSSHVCSFTSFGKFQGKFLQSRNPNKK